MKTQTLFKNQQFGRREFLKFAGLAGMAFASGICLADTTSSDLKIVRTSTGVRIFATVNPVSSAWAIERSTDGGASWTTLADEGVVIGSNQIRWDIPIDANKPVGKFRTKLMTVIQIGNKTYRIEANGQTLFAAMEGLRTSDPSFSFVSDYRTNPQGQFVTAINGVTEIIGVKRWVFEVDGQRIDDIGSSNYIPKLGNRIKWRMIV